MYRVIGLPLLWAAVALLGGCSVVETAKEPRIESASPYLKDGYLYYLPKTTFEIVLLWNKNAPRPFVVDIDSDDVQHVADRDAPLVLQYRESPFSEDQLCITSEKGLITSVQAVATDRTGEILINIAELFARIVRTPAVAPGRKFQALRTDDEAKGYTVIARAVIDSSNKDTVTAANSLFSKYLNNPRYGGRMGGTRSVDLGLEKIVARDRPKACPQAHICYRKILNEVLSIKIDGNLAQTLVVPMVNTEITPGISVTRAFLVEKVTFLEFENGDLKHIFMRKPSELLALSELPLRVLDRILATPTNFVHRLFAGADTRSQLKTEVGNSGASGPNRAPPAPGFVIAVATAAAPNAPRCQLQTVPPK